MVKGLFSFLSILLLFAMMFMMQFFKNTDVQPVTHPQQSVGQQAGGSLGTSSISQETQSEVLRPMADTKPSFGEQEQSRERETGDTLVDDPRKTSTASMQPENQQENVANETPIKNPTVASSDLGTAIVAQANQYLGQNNEDGKFGEDPYGWCVLFVNHVIQEVTGNPVPWGNPAADRDIYDWAKNNNRLKSAKDAKPGDILLTNVELHPTEAHTCIIESIDADGTIHTIDGNLYDEVGKKTISADDPSISGVVSMS